MLNRLPRHVPSFVDLIAEVCPRATAAQIGRALGVSARTVRRWKAADAPVSARLALWWISDAGSSAWDAEHGNRAGLVAAWAACRRMSDHSGAAG